DRLLSARWSLQRHPVTSERRLGVGPPIRTRDQSIIGRVGHTPGMFPSFYLLGLAQAARTDAARVGMMIDYMRDEDEDNVVEPPRAGLPRLVTIEVRPEEVGPNGVKLDEASRAKLAAAGADVAQVERELHGMRRGDRKLLGDVVYGTEGGAPRG